MDDKVLQALQEAHLDVEDLTDDELKQLREEVEIEAEGGMVLDGVLMNPNIRIRHMQNHAAKRQ